MGEEKINYLKKLQGIIAQDPKEFFEIEGIIKSVYYEDVSKKRDKYIIKKQTEVL
ncbi:hypothetical protein KQI18_09630 [Clostridioides mangenotii]|uniref:hypothetical protein n=1 Tax=Metaclostridioides mangenotii TaxID=1540 RepID=UPI001C11B88E|nr:hypothetical protein [Clostridioides mangenotii]MBU5308037.1 hypothetical protein [Clostridioides mangenotii]